MKKKVILAEHVLKVNVRQCNLLQDRSVRVIYSLGLTFPYYFKFVFV